MKFFITPNKNVKNNTMPMENIYCDEPPEQVTRNNNNNSAT